LKTAKRGLEFFEALFNSSYQLPKLDLVAIPDFAAGAMENWGLLTFRTTKLLCDSNKTDIAAEKRIADAILHEISHQWLGNLVTMKTWASLWLKESLATWMAHYARDKLFDAHDAWREFITEKQQSALELDSLRSSHPIENLEYSKNESVQTFDDISYRKGCSVLLMLAKSIGEESFFEGIRIYLGRHKFASASSKDFWGALEESSNSKVGDWMSVWTRTQGFPVVKVSTSFHPGNSTQKNRCHHIQVSQKRFLLGGKITPDEATVIYPLQLSIRSRNGVEEFPFQERDISLPVLGTEIFKVNADHLGFYRTWYEKGHLCRLGEAHSEGWLSVEDRVGLISDTTAIAKAGLQNASDLLDLIHAMHSDTNYHVWVQIIKSLNTLRSAWFFGDEEIVNGLDQHFQAVIRRKIGTEGLLKNRNLSGDLKALLLRACGQMRRAV
jgi:aminopeptidase 2